MLSSKFSAPKYFNIFCFTARSCYSYFIVLYCLIIKHSCMAIAFSSNDENILFCDSTINNSDTNNCKITSDENIPEKYEVEKCIEFIKEHNCETVALQFPDELLVDATRVVKIFESKSSANFFLLADTTFGSYDVDEVAAHHIESDLIIHFGNSSLLKSSQTKTIFVFGQKSLESDLVCKSFFASYSDENTKVVLMIQPQYSHLASFLEEEIKTKHSNLVLAKLFVPNPISDDDMHVPCVNNCSNCSCHTDNEIKIQKDCSYTNKCYRIGFYEVSIPENYSIDEYSLFFVGNNDSKILKTALYSFPSLSGFLFDTKTMICSSISSSINKILTKRYYRVEQIKDARSIGILVGTMGVAGFCDIISYLKKIFSACGKKTYTFLVGKLNPNKLANFAEIDIFILVACPEESIVNSKEYFKPICTPYEAEVACNANREWNGSYLLDFRQLLPGGECFIEFKPRQDADVSLISGKLRLHDDVSNQDCDVAVRNIDSQLSVFHPNAAVHRFSSRSWTGLEQKLGETSVEKVHVGRSGLPIGYIQSS